MHPSFTGMQEQVAESQDGSKATILDLFKTPNMCFKTCIMYFDW